jgi:hypothetical protein
MPHAARSQDIGVDSTRTLYRVMQSDSRQSPRRRPDDPTPPRVVSKTRLRHDGEGKHASRARADLQRSWVPPATTRAISLHVRIRSLASGFTLLGGTRAEIAERLIARNGGPSLFGTAALSPVVLSI